MSRAIDVHRHAGVAAVPVPVRRVGALARRVVMRAVGVRLGQRVADVARRRLAGAVVAALLHPAAQVLDGGRARVERHGRGLRDRVGVDSEHPGAPPRTRSTTAFSLAYCRPPTCRTVVFHDGAGAVDTLAWFIAYLLLPEPS